MEFVAGSRHHRFSRVRQRKPAIEFADDFSEREKDYLLNVAFTRRQPPFVATGHLRESATSRTRGDFTPTANRTIRTPDRSASGSLAWSSNRGDVRLFQLDRAREHAAHDTHRRSGLPPWIATQLRERVPPMFDYYAAKMKAPTSASGRSFSFVRRRGIPAIGSRAGRCAVSFSSMSPVRAG